MPLVTSSPLPQQTLPPPSTYDILPPLHTILSRLLLPSSQTSSQPSTSPQAAISPATSQNAITTPLSPKDLTTAASAVKNKIQKARVVTSGLPDMERTVEQQEEEINELEEEVERLTGVLRGISGMAKNALQESGR